MCAKIPNELESTWTYFYDILQGFQPTEVKYVQPILALMEEDPKTLIWDKHTGEIIFKNKPVKDSNVIELLKVH